MIFIIILFIFLLYINLIKRENFKNDIQISVIILNYKRPHNLKKSIPELLKIKAINEIIILNGDKDNNFKTNHSKIRCIDDWENNNNIYTMRKFKNYSLCKNNIILSLDDDILPSHDLIYNMIKNYQKDKNNFYGTDSRICNEKEYKVGGDSFILTNIFLTSKNIIKNTWNSMKKNKKLFQLVIDQKGNCEDLFFNYEFKKLYKKNPTYVKGKYTSLDNSNGFSTTKPKNHSLIRKKFCKLISK